MNPAVNPAALFLGYRNLVNGNQNEMFRIMYNNDKKKSNNYFSQLITNAYEGTEFSFEEENIKAVPNDIKFEADFKQFFIFYNVILQNA